MARCRVCGKYTDYYEWNPEERENYKPNMCFDCYQESLASEDDNETQEDDTEDISEVDDSPDLQEDDGEQQETEEENDQESEPLSDEAQNIQNIRRMLFG